MTLIRWSEQLQLGHPLLDEDHREMVRLTNALSDALHGNDRAAFEARADTLIKHTLAHFDREEQAMIEFGYEDLEQHRLSHRGLIIQIRVFRTAVAEDLLDPGRRMVSFLHDWLIMHILKQDRDLAAFLAGQAEASHLQPRSDGSPCR